jgi:hypothetical protein
VLRAGIIIWHKQEVLTTGHAGDDIGVTYCKRIVHTLVMRNDEAPLCQRIPRVKTLVTSLGLLYKLNIDYISSDWSTLFT